MNHYIAPSLLACDFTNIEREVEMVNRSEADYFHCDVMDGVFVPNISFGFPIIKAIHKHAKLPLDVHLMIENPQNYVQQFHDVGAAIITVHEEVCPHLHRIIQQIQETGSKAGVAINPHTSINSLENILEMVDLVCVMSVNPGFGGQKFIYQTLQKISKLRDMIDTINSDALIEVDGGVGLHNAQKILEAGANILVAGSSVFKSDDPLDTISKLKGL